MLVPFTLVILAATARGFDIPCGCAGFADQDTPVGWYKVGENALLIAAALLVRAGWSMTVGGKPRVKKGGKESRIPTTDGH